MKINFSRTQRSSMDIPNEQRNALFERLNGDKEKMNIAFEDIFRQAMKTSSGRKAFNIIQISKTDWGRDTPC